MNLIGSPSVFAFSAGLTGTDILPLRVGTPSSSLLSAVKVKISY